jgi:outer membrane protein OmpA-like peptidoglycan-associated protein
MRQADLPRSRAKWVPKALAGVAAAALLLSAAPAGAQQTTFHLDRLEVPGAPDDGLVLFRPVTQKPATFYAQLGLGLAVDPLRAANITQDQNELRINPRNAITTQFGTYLSAGFELLDRAILGLTWPVAWEQSGTEILPPGAGFGNPFAQGTGHTTYSPNGPAVGDTRLDFRYVIDRSDDRSTAYGFLASYFIPTGGGSSTNFGGDIGFRGMLMLTGELRPQSRWWWMPIFVGNTGLDFRPETGVNDPGARTSSVHNGLGIGPEWRLAVGALLPLKDDQYRVGVTVFTQTGLQGSGNKTTGNTFFTAQNTPVEFNVEGRMRVPYAIAGEKWYAGAGAGSRIVDGYGAPDFRIVVLAGMYLPIEDTNPRSPEARMKVHLKIHESMKDTDGDGIPDDIDACPNEPEDHKDPDPNDGCPQPSDRDGDGIPDNVDKCPDVPEDKDGIDDQDGCPEDDADQDGIPDAKDACPKEPGQPDPDPKKNGCPKFIKLEGSSVRVLQQVHFQTGSATILPDSFPMLGEIASLLKATPGIKRMRIEGHTDNHGAADMNLDLSKRRAASVRQWLIDHGIASGRLESEGYGLTQPIDTNDTDAGRAANRRVEFKITEEDSSVNAPRK